MTRRERMSMPFSAAEILEIAEQIERNADRFYRRVAHETNDPSLRQTLLNLAAMENEHQKVLAAMRAELSSQEREPTVPDPWGEAVLYLRGIADGHVFDIKRDPVEWLTGEETKEDILKAAIDHEKDSIVFYLGMKELVPEELGKQRVDRIIREEMGHVALLSSELASSKR
jgi:rubrerythrin